MTNNKFTRKNGKELTKRENWVLRNGTQEELHGVQIAIWDAEEFGTKEDLEKAEEAYDEAYGIWYKNYHGVSIK